MPAEDLDRRLAQDVADAELAHVAERYATVVGMALARDSDQAQLASARRRLQEAAHAYCQAYGHADAP
jgi:hypothetical protein